MKRLWPSHPAGQHVIVTAKQGDNEHARSCAYLPCFEFLLCQLYMFRHLRPLLLQLDRTGLHISKGPHLDAASQHTQHCTI